MSNRAVRGFTLIELLIVVAVIAIIAAIALPGLLRARASSNEASAIASLRTINSSQMVYSTSCGQKFYAATLGDLAASPGSGQPGFISPDLGGPLDSAKSGYRVEMAGTAIDDPPQTPCNGGVLATGYYATASPLVAGITGTRYFWTNVGGAVYSQTTDFQSTNEAGEPDSDTAALPIQ